MGVPGYRRNRLDRHWVTPGNVFHLGLGSFVPGKRCVGFLSMARIKTQSAKAKGRALQQHVRDRILAMFPVLREGDVESRAMGSSGTDILLSPAARDVFPVSVECKKTKKTPSCSELAQSKANQSTNTVPAVVWCPHGKGPQHSLIMFELEEFLTFWVKWNEGGN